MAVGEGDILANEAADIFFGFEVFDGFDFALGEFFDGEFFEEVGIFIVTVRVVARRGLGKCREDDALGEGEFGGVFVEVDFGGFLDTVGVIAVWNAV